MKEITLRFNSNQYKALLKLVYLGEWMLNSHLDHKDDKLTIEEEVEQMIYASNTEPGLCEFDDGLQIYFPTRDFEQKMQPFIDAYDNFNFRAELAYQLADRDTKDELGDTFEKIDAIEYIKIHHKYLEIYTQEFINNNLNNLKTK